MAVPASFDESNSVLSAPLGMEEKVEPLSVWLGFTDPPEYQQPVVLSCWKLTAEELAEVNRTGRVWLWIWGATMPPAVVNGTHPFQKD